MAQPRAGLCWAAPAVTLSAVATYLGIHVVGMAPPQFLATVTVPFLFGSIVVPTGPPGFDGEVWLASALLGVTFHSWPTTVPSSACGRCAPTDCQGEVGVGVGVGVGEALGDGVGAGSGAVISGATCSAILRAPTAVGWNR
jgi:hypothetical protein